jgi:glycosyltransferase involved in cell wall biosynthesis
LLGKAINSVLRQTVSDFELIIVDDGSSDGSAETIQAYLQCDSRITHIRFDKNVGLPALTCAKAFLESRGDYIAWIFDDCEWDNTYLAEMSNLFEGKPNISIAYAQCEAHFSTGSKIFGIPLNKDSMMAGNNHIPNVTTIVRRSVYYEVGWYDPRILLIRLNDWDFLQRCIRAGVQIAHLPKVLAHEHGVSLLDSLGNSYDTVFELVQLFANSDRKKELQPDNVSTVDPISVPAGVVLTDELRTDYIRLLVEFAILSEREDIIKSITFTEIYSCHVQYPVNFFQIIKWWASVSSKKWRKDIRDRDLRIQEKQNFIDKQQVYIDAQQDYIEKNNRDVTEFWSKEVQIRDSHIQEKQDFIDKQQAYIDAQQGYIKK